MILGHHWFYYFFDLEGLHCLKLYNVLAFFSSKFFIYMFPIFQQLFKSKTINYSDEDLRKLNL